MNPESEAKEVEGQDDQPSAEESSKKNESSIQRFFTFDRILSIGIAIVSIVISSFAGYHAGVIATKSEIRQLGERVSALEADNKNNKEDITNLSKKITELDQLKAQVNEMSKREILSIQITRELDLAINRERASTLDALNELLKKKY